jgi:hypothetical protein
MGPGGQTLMICTPRKSRPTASSRGPGTWFGSIRVAYIGSRPLVGVIMWPGTWGHWPEGSINWPLRDMSGTSYSISSQSFQWYISAGIWRETSTFRILNYSNWSSKSYVEVVIVKRIKYLLISLQRLSFSSPYFRMCLMKTLIQCAKMLEFVKAKKVQKRFHGRTKNEASHYCGHCEVWGSVPWFYVHLSSGLVF